MTFDVKKYSDEATKYRNLVNQYHELTEFQERLNNPIPIESRDKSNHLVGDDLVIGVSSYHQSQGHRIRLIDDGGMENVNETIRSILKMGVKERLEEIESLLKEQFGGVENG